MKMTIRLGMQMVTAIDDPTESIFFLSRVLSSEVCHSLIKLILRADRMKSKERTILKTTYAQIFFEILGQVYHE